MDEMQIIYSNNADEIIAFANECYDSTDTATRDMAIKAYERVIELEPNNPFAINKAANCYFLGLVL